MAAAAAASTVSLKLFIDSKTRTVLFAEAGKSFVDFLFHLLLFPIGSVSKLVSQNSMFGSLVDLCSSIEDLNDTYLLPNAKTDVILNPKAHILPKSAPDTKAAAAAAYACDEGCGYYSYEAGSICPQCHEPNMNWRMAYVVPEKTEGSVSGFVKDGVMYMVMPYSAISTLNVLDKYDIKDFGSIEVKDVHLGVDEGEKLLQTYLNTKSVLTTVFLP